MCGEFKPKRNVWCLTIAALTVGAFVTRSDESQLRGIPATYLREISRCMVYRDVFVHDTFF